MTLEASSFNFSWARSPESDARQERLLQKHWRAWLGPLADRFREAPAFEGGFPIAGVMHHHSYVAPDIALKWLEHREWRTFRSLSVRGLPLEVVLPHRNFQSLREVHEVDGDEMKALRRFGQRLTAVTLGYRQTRRRIALEPLRALTRLGVSLRHLDLVSDEVLNRLASLRLRYGGDDSLTGVMKRLRSLSMTEIELFGLRLTRERGGVPFRELEFLSGDPEELQQVLTELPEIRKVNCRVPQVAITSERFDELERALRGRELEFDHHPFKRRALALEERHAGVAILGVAWLDEHVVARAWAMLTDGFGVRFDTYRPASQAHRIEGDPIECLKKWANRETCKALVLGIADGQSRARFVRGVAQHTTLNLPAGNPERFIRALRALVAWSKPKGLLFYVGGRERLFEGKRVAQGVAELAKCVRDQVTTFATSSESSDREVFD